ncbi:MAG: DUF1152 domain-containing protein [Armatimonadota bacterium]
MRLNLPILDELARCRSLLIAGLGDGYDLYAGLPIYFELRQLGVNVHLGSHSFSPFLNYLKEGVRLSRTLTGVTADHPGFTLNFPELDLARWLRREQGEAATVWTFHKSGGRPMAEDYHRLAEHLELDGILLVQAGMRALLRGDESSAGEAVEDLLHLAAVDSLAAVPLRRLACVGFGAEPEVRTADLLRNTADLCRTGAFLGSCSLLPQMPAARRYLDAVHALHALPHQDRSAVNAAVVAAVEGRFAEGASAVHPLMAAYWLFDLPALAEKNLFVPALRETESAREALYVITKVRSETGRDV